MIDPDVAVEKVTEDLIVDVLSDIETDAPHLSGALPSNQIAMDIARRVVYAVIEDLVTPALGFCNCLAPIFPETLEEGNCVVCGRSISLRIRRTA